MATTQALLSEAVEAFHALGAAIVDVQFPDVTQTIADWVPNCAVEAAVAHEATYPARKDEYGPVLASVIDAGRALSGLDYQKIPAAARRSAWPRRCAVRHCSLLVPVHPFAPLWRLSGPFRDGSGTRPFYAAWTGPNIMK